jgi:hypothetical protein
MSVSYWAQGSTGWLFTHRDGADTLLPLDPATAAAAAAIAPVPSTPPNHDFTVTAVRAAASRQGGMVYIETAWFPRLTRTRDSFLPSLAFYDKVRQSGTS